MPEFGDLNIFRHVLLYKKFIIINDKKYMQLNYFALTSTANAAAIKLHTTRNSVVAAKP